VYTKFNSDLSSEGFSVFTNPLEVLFIILSKVDWNEKLKIKKNQQILQVIKNISGENISFANDAEKLKVSGEQIEFDKLGESYKGLFEILSG
jgi:hypothetical protein